MSLVIAVRDQTSGNVSGNLDTYCSTVSKFRERASTLVELICWGEKP